MLLCRHFPFQDISNQAKNINTKNWNGESIDEEQKITASQFEWNKRKCLDWNIKLAICEMIWAFEHIQMKIHTYTCTPATLTFIGMRLLILIDAVNNHKIPIESRIKSLAMTFLVILQARAHGAWMPAAKIAITQWSHLLRALSF